jgi:hypothetical protein
LFKVLYFKKVTTTERKGHRMIQVEDEVAAVHAFFFFTKRACGAAGN